MFLIILNDNTDYKIIDGKIYINVYYFVLQL